MEETFDDLTKYAGCHDGGEFIEDACRMTVISSCLGGLLIEDVNAPLIMLQMAPFYGTTNHQIHGLRAVCIKRVLLSLTCGLVPIL